MSEPLKLTRLQWLQRRDFIQLLNEPGGKFNVMAAYEWPMNRVEQAMRQLRIKPEEWPCMRPLPSTNSQPNSDSHEQP